MPQSRVRVIDDCLSVGALDLLNDRNTRVACMEPGGPTALELRLPHLLVMMLMADVEKLRPHMQQVGLDLQLSWCKI